MSEQRSPNVVEQSVNKFFVAFEQAQQSISIDNVYGKPITYGDSVIVPIAGVSQVCGVGGGIGSDDNDGSRDEGLGGGGGTLAGARPIALAEIDADGVKVHPIVDENRALAASLAFAAWAVFWTARTLIKIFQGTAKR